MIKGIASLPYKAKNWNKFIIFSLHKTCLSTGEYLLSAQLAFTCSKSALEILVCVKFVKS